MIQEASRSPNASSSPLHWQNQKVRKGEEDFWIGRNLEKPAFAFLPDSKSWFSPRGNADCYAGFEKEKCLKAYSRILVINCLAPIQNRNGQAHMQEKGGIFELKKRKRNFITVLMKGKEDNRF